MNRLKLAAITSSQSVFRFLNGAAAINRFLINVNFTAVAGKATPVSYFMGLS
jgi:hypothetical protein